MEQPQKEIRQRNGYNPEVKEYKNVLILHDLYDSVHFNQLYDHFVKHLYLLVFLLRNVYKDGAITINDRGRFQYKHIWKPGSGLFYDDSIDKLVSSRQLHEIDFLQYDLVICHPLLQDELKAHLNSCLWEITNLPFRIMSLHVYKGDKYLFESVYHLFRNDIGETVLSPEAENEFNELKLELDQCFEGFRKEAYENLYSDVIKKIHRNNAELLGKEIKKILVLDDHHRKFFIGDACVWFLYNTRKTVHSISRNAVYRVNCCNKKVYRKLKEIFDGSFDSNSSFTNNAWDEINFSSYDLILCHPDSIFKLLAYFDGKHPHLLPSAAVYYYNNMLDTKSITDGHQWNYSLLVASMAAGKKASTAANWLRTSDKEIVVTSEQRQWADKWFEANGVGENERIVILPEGASTMGKTLPSNVFNDVLQWMLSLPNIRVLLFDEKGTGKKKNLVARYGVADETRIIVAEQFGIRQDLHLLCSKYVSAVIGPCTGVMHLASFAYTYFKNHGIIDKDKLPSLIVYTGNFEGIVNDYHPRDWWLGSLVKCAVLCKDGDGGKVIRKLGQCATGHHDYCETTLPVDQFSADILISFIENNTALLKQTVLEPVAE